MAKTQKQTIQIDNNNISIGQQQGEDYISLTDMAHSQMQEHIIFKWMSLKSTIEKVALQNVDVNSQVLDEVSFP